MNSILAAIVLAQAIVPALRLPGTAVTSTSAPMSLFVATTGSDANPCTSVGAPCLTIDGALNKLPNMVNHAVTITVAAGAYATTLNITRKDLTISAGSTVSVTGAMATATPATGTATGTTTAAAAGSTSGPGTITDSGQTWTTSDLKNKFIRFTSGAVSGQSYPISANTATVITIPANVSPGVGSTYIIEDIASTFIATGASTWRGLLGTGTLAISNIKLERTSGSGASPNIGAVLALTNVWVKSSTGNGLFVQSGVVTATRSIFEGTTGSGIGITSVLGTSTGSGLPVLGVTQSIARATTGSGVSIAAFPASGTFLAVIAEVTTGVGLANAGAIRAQAPSTWVTCSSTGVGVRVGSSLTTSSSPAYASMSMNGAVRITGCATGVEVVGYSSALLNGPVFDTVTTALSAVQGGTVDLFATTPGFTAVTNELAIDGTFYTLAALDALGAPKIYTNNYGSRLIR